jgi:hypothetical protein
VDVRVKIEWDLPDEHGDPVTQYIIELRTNDGKTFETTPDCDGSDSNIVTDRECSVLL